jgi:hypothetical protein
MISDLSRTEAGGASVIAGQKPPGLPSTVLVPCISLWRPWAEWVTLGWKTIETRLHPRFESLAGQRIGIHAAKVWDKAAMHAARQYLTDEQFEQTYVILRDNADNAGKVLGTVFAKEHRLLDPDDAPAALIECQTIRFGLILREPNKFATPIAVTGRQGIFKVELPSG